MRMRGAMAVAGVLTAGRVLAQDDKTHVFLETGAVTVSRNVARIRGDSGTYFSLKSLLGGGGRGYGRVTALHSLTGHRGLRLVVAPLSVRGTGVLSHDTRFAGTTFAGGVSTTATYQFNSYRLSYWRQIASSDRALWRAGLTLKVRDAKISLRQGEKAAQDANLGFVPLLYVSADLKLAERWRLWIDLDGLAAPQGRAVDLAVQAGYALTPRLSVFLGGRTLEGGAANDRVFNFAWLNYAALGLALRF